MGAFGDGMEAMPVELRSLAHQQSSDSTKLLERQKKILVVPLVGGAERVASLG